MLANVTFTVSEKLKTFDAREGYFTVSEKLKTKNF